MRRGDTGRRFAPAWRTFAVAAGLALGAGSVAVFPPTRATTTSIQSGAGAARREANVEGRAGGANAGRGGIDESGSQAGPGSTLACAPGRNGGATDVGVTATSIRLGATVVDSGIGATFLRDARYSMTAVKNRVNRSAGVCGRQLDLTMVDDGWRSDLGAQFLRNLVEDKKVFALAVVPSSEGLKNVSDAGYLRRKKIPVVGSDGMLIHQYTDPFIWPVAASTMSTMRIMAKAAYDRGARHFSIVYEHTYSFGPEGAYAFNAAVKRLTGDDIPGYSDPLKNPQCPPGGRFCGIAAGQASYNQEVNRFNIACTATEPNCDFVALLLEPATALTWLKDGGINPHTYKNIEVAGPQPLFTRSFGEECGSRCGGVWLWSGYKPPIGANLARPGIAAYVKEMKATSASTDFANTFAVGAYLGMEVLVQALREVGPALTRERLTVVLDRMTFRSDLLLSPLRWRKGKHFANVRMKAYSIDYRERFAGWRDRRTEVEDPSVGKDMVD